MDITVLHQSVLDDLVEYDNYTRYCDDECILPGSLLFIEEATKYDFTLTYNGTKSLKSFVEEDVRDHIQLDNRFEVSYAMYLIEQERDIYYNFVSDEAYETLEAAIDLIEDLDYQYHNVWLEEDTSEIDYQAILTKVNEYQTKIKQLIEKTYQLSVVPYIEEYHRLFDRFDNPDTSKIVKLPFQDWKPSESESINVIHSDAGSLPKSLAKMKGLVTDRLWCQTLHEEDYRDYYESNHDFERAYIFGIPYLKNCISNIIAIIEQEEQQGFNTVQVTIKENLKKLETYCSNTIKHNVDMLSIVERSESTMELCGCIHYHLQEAYEFYLDLYNHAIKLYAAKYKEQFNEELNDVEPVEFDYNKWYSLYHN